MSIPARSLAAASAAKQPQMTITVGERERQDDDIASYKSRQAASSSGPPIQSCRTQNSEGNRSGIPGEDTERD